MNKTTLTIQQKTFFSLFLARIPHTLSSHFYLFIYLHPGYFVFSLSMNLCCFSSILGRVLRNILQRRFVCRRFWGRILQINLLQGVEEAEGRKQDLAKEDVDPWYSLDTGLSPSHGALVLGDPPQRMSNWSNVSKTSGHRKAETWPLDVAPWSQVT